MVADVLLEETEDTEQDDGRPAYSQSSRLQTRISVPTRERLAGILVDRKGAARVVAEAEKMGLREALRYCSMDVIENGLGTKLTVTPTHALLDKAEADYVSAHIYLRAAAVKIGEQLMEEAEMDALIVTLEADLARLKAIRKSPDNGS